MLERDRLHRLDEKPLLLLAASQRASNAHDIPGPLLVRLAQVFSERAAGEAGAQLGLVELATCLGTMSSSEIASLDLASLARTTRAVPFASIGDAGGSSGVVPGRTRRGSVEAMVGARFDPLVLGLPARGVLGPVLDDPRIAYGTVQPVLEAYLDGLSSRSGRSGRWGLPCCCCWRVSGRRLSVLLAEVASKDADGSPGWPAWMKAQRSE